MKRFLILFSIIIIAAGGLYPDVVKNPDKPFKGEWEFKCKAIWQIESFNDQLLAEVQKIAVHDNGDIYLFDSKHYKFFVLDKTGKPKFTFGKKGEGPGEIKYMLSFFLVGDHVVVSDLGKIHYFDLDGKYIKSAPSSSTVGIAPLLFIDENRFVKVRSTFSLKVTPEALEIKNLTSDSTVYLAGEPLPAGQKGPGGVVVMITNRTANERRKVFVVGKTSDTLFWGKNDTYLIRACDFSGKERFSFSIEGRKLKKITQKFKEKIASRMSLSIRGGGQSEEELKKRVISRLPDESTYFYHIEPAANGLIYVYVSDTMWENGQEIDIFSPAGKYLYHGDIYFPDVSRFVADGIVMKGDFVYGVAEDEEGDISLRKYSIQNPKK